jgi:hypothetical protein
MGINQDLDKLFPCSCLYSTQQFSLFPARVIKFYTRALYRYIYIVRTIYCFLLYEKLGYSQVWCYLMSVGKLTRLSEQFLIFDDTRRVKRQSLAFSDTSEGDWTCDKTKECPAYQ